MDILYASDTHVYPAHIERLLKAAAKLHPGAVMIGGDIIPDWIGSIAESIQPHKLWVKEKLLPRLRMFHEELPGTAVCLDLGNDDIAASRPLLEEKDGRELHLLHMKVIRLGGNLAVAGYMAVTPTPFLIKDNEKPDCREDDGLSGKGVRRTGYTTHTGISLPHTLDPANGTIEDDLDELSRILQNPPWLNCPFLFVCHSPPKDTVLDRTGKGLNVGSFAVRKFIEKWSPTGRLLASLHGHIHESPWETGRVWQFIENVPCFNIGQHQKTLRALWFNTDKIESSARLVTVDRSGEVRVGKRDEWL